MILRAIAGIVVVAFVLSSVPMEYLSVRNADTVNQEAGEEHHRGSCPDETPEGDPCSDGCDCLCCPGHARILLPGGQTASATLLFQSGSLSDPCDDIHPLDVVFRIFHPPRAV